MVSVDGPKSGGVPHPRVPMYPAVSPARMRAMLYATVVLPLVPVTADDLDRVARRAVEACAERTEVLHDAGGDDVRDRRRHLSFGDNGDGAGVDGIPDEVVTVEGVAAACHEQVAALDTT